MPALCLVHHKSLMAGHWCKAASEAVAPTRDPLAFVDSLPCLAQDDSHEMPVSRPTRVLSSVLRPSHSRLGDAKEGILCPASPRDCNKLLVTHPN